MKSLNFIGLLIVLNFFQLSRGQLSLAQQNDIISLHNQARLNADPTPDIPLPSLNWNITLANYAQNWSSQCLYDYSDYFWFRLYGENVALVPSGSIDINQIFSSWLSSGDDYDYNTLSCTNQGFKCDPYLQIIWQRSTQIGCGFTACPGGDFLVCSYDPPGAWPGVKPYNSSTNSRKKITNEWKLGVPQNDLKGRAKQIEMPENVTNIDWRQFGVVTYARDQGTCGSCWTFVSVATMESQFSIQTDGAVQVLSEEQLLDCSREYPNDGCDGGFPETAFKYVINTAKGSARLSAYPYTGLQTLCDYKSSMKAAQFKRTQAIPNTHEDFIAALQEIGPFPVFVATDVAWQNYGGGIIQCPTTLPITHAVTLVGWDNDTQAYLIKNSWGPSWGEAGFGYIDKEQNCGMFRFATSIILMT